MKARLLIILMFVGILDVISVFGQKRYSTNDLRKFLNHMFEHIDKDCVPTGLLRDYAIEDENLDLFSGDVMLNEDNVTTLVRYGNLLNTIGSASLSNDLSKKIVKSLKSYSASGKNDVLSLSVLLFKYARIRENALTDRLIRYENGQVYLNNKNKSPFRTAYVFAGCCLTATTYENSITIKFPASLSFSNCDIKKIEIDYGKGYHSITTNSSIQATLKKGLNKLILKATLTSGEQLYAHTIVEVLDRPAKTRTYTSTTTNTEFTKWGKDYRGIKTGAEISIAYAPGHQSLKKPFIIVEGFDPRVFEHSPKGLWNFYNRVIPNQKILYLKDKLGYDIVYVDWIKPEEYIQANANTLIEVINSVNKLKNDAGSHEPNVIIGHSMGGLITRYALKTMENNGIKHQTSTYISYDAPHLGAHIPLGVLYGFHGILSFIESRGILKALLKNVPYISSYINLGKSMAYATSAQQMLAYFVDPAGNFNNQEHVQWQKEINALGFPKGDIGLSFIMLAVANGSYKKPNIPSYYLKTDFTGGSDIIPTVFYPTLAPIVGIGLNDIVSGLLELLPGRTSIRGGFEIYPAKAAGDHVTHINLKYEKKFLWLVPISSTVFSYNKYFNGGYLFDSYPSSSYSIQRDDKGNPIWQKNGSGGIPVVYDYDFNINVNPSIPFVPTSSALAYGDGLSNSSSNFFSEPKGLSSPFAENYFVHTESLPHSYFSDAGLDWITTRLSTSIIGPKVGYSGAKYVLSSSEKGGDVKWDIDKPEIATINSSGILSVKGKGIIVITANYNNQKYSQTIMVGIPRYILSASHEPRGYKITAECIDPEYKEMLSQLNGVLKFNWGVKYPNKEIRWLVSDKSDLTIEIKGQNESVTVFLEVEDALGNKTTLQHINVNNHDVYISKYSIFYIDHEGKLYDAKKEWDLYESSRVYLSYNPNISDKYKGREWMPMTAIVLSPLKGYHEIDVNDDGPLVKDILPESEFDFIKNNSIDNQTYNYMLVLLNFDHKVIQFMPINFTFKTII